MTTTRSDIQKRAESAIWQYAIFRWESALVIALTIVLSLLLPRPFGWWPPYGWLLLGLVGLAALIYSSVTDAETNAKVVLRLFQEQFDVGRIKDKELRTDLETALEYQRRIEVQRVDRRRAPGAVERRFAVADAEDRLRRHGMRRDCHG